MESFQGLFYLLVVLLRFNMDQTIMQRLPVCISYSSPCHVSFNVSSMPSMSPSEPTCFCSSNLRCNDPDRTLTLELTSSEERITAALSYCPEVHVIPERTCNNTEIAVILRWWGPISVDMVGDVKCRCSMPLAVVKIEQNIGFSNRYFACGTPTCNVSESAPQACERMTVTETGYLDKSELPCRCPCGYSCDVDLSKSVPGEMTEFFCKTTTNTTDST